MTTSSNPSQHTPLYQSHIDAGAKLVDFAGWQMPVNYGSQIDEHNCVRQKAGMFDVSHMTILDLGGDGCDEFLSQLLANDIAKASQPGKALYSCMLNAEGGVIDDLIAYHRGNFQYRLIVNASTRDQDIAWILQHKPASVTVQERPELALIAVQGPEAMASVLSCLSAELSAQVATLKRFTFAEAGDWFIARTGYTGEDGVEIALPAAEAAALWSALLEQGVQPCGLGARDTLRLEAGMHLYGSDMDEKISPIDTGLDWTIALEPATRDFIGRAALENRRAQGNMTKLKGLVLDGRGVLRGGYEVFSGEQQVGVVTSGTFSPTLSKSIALARVDADISEHCEVLVRGRRLPVTVVKLPFVRNGQALY